MSASLQGRARGRGGQAAIKDIDLWLKVARFVDDKERRRFERAVRGAATLEELPDRYRQLPGGAASCRGNTWR
jgi:hypothetical protein